MHLTARKDDQVILATQAYKQTDYVCVACGSRVRLRKGFHRQPHFYHLDSNRDCFLSGKSLVHLQVQLRIVDQLPQNETQLECSFPIISRIADVAWLPKKIVFEVQCSSISMEEVEKRNKDYRSLGWEVVWILHDQRYNQARLSEPEIYLRNHPHYFTNIDFEGLGIIYDQWDCVDLDGRVRWFKLSPLSLQLGELAFINQNHKEPSRALLTIKDRFKHWPCYFGGDLMDLFFRQETHENFEKAIQIENRSLKRKKRWQEILLRVGHFLDFYLLRPYRILFQILLEKNCR